MFRPPQEHAALSDVELQKALAAFGITATSFSLLTGGFEGGAWRIESGLGRFVAKRTEAEASTISAVEAILSWMDRLHATQPRLAPRPLRRNDGSLSPFLINNSAALDSLWTICAWVDGSTLGRWPTPNEAHAIGSLIARLHGVTVALPIATVPCYDATHFRAQSDRYLRAFGAELRPAQRRVLDAALSKSLRECEAQWRGGDDIGMIHADIHDGNLIWTPEDATPTPIDFSRSGLGPRWFDLAMAQHFLPAELGPALAEGYAAQRGLDPDEASGQLATLRFLAAIDNAATLLPDQAEHDGLRADVPWLVGQAEALIP